MWNEPALTIGPLNSPSPENVPEPLIVPYSESVCDVSVVNVPEPTREAWTSDLVYWLIPCEVNRPEAFTVPLTRYKPSLTRQASTPLGNVPLYTNGNFFTKETFYCSPYQRIHLLP